jgi:hypothetical protein
MSTGLECRFIEYQLGQWYYILQNWNCPVGAWDWREYATAYGPFSNQEAAEAHLSHNHANPGGCSIGAYHESYAKDEVYQKLVKDARK